jgi:hypothetical protein
VVEVDAVGAGALLVHRVVFDRIQDLPADRFLTVTGFCIDCRKKQPPIHSFVKVEEGKPLVCPVCGGGNIRVRKPWFEWTMGKKERGVSEDFDFAEKARECGFRILCDTSLVCFHDVSGKVGEKGIEAYGI